MLLPPFSSRKLSFFVICIKSTPRDSVIAKTGLLLPAGDQTRDPSKWLRVCPQELFLLEGWRGGTWVDEASPKEAWASKHQLGGELGWGWRMQAAENPWCWRRGSPQTGGAQCLSLEYNDALYDATVRH